MAKKTKISKRAMRAEVQGILDSHLLIAPHKLKEFVMPLLEAMKSPQPESFRHQFATRDSEPFQRQGPTAVIPVMGPLVHRASFWATSYEGISQSLQAALADDSIENVMLLIDSPGGQSAGVFDLADEIRAARDVKNIVALANDFATSAAYMIGASADEFFTTQTGLTGSIGVVMTHMDVSKAMKDFGLKATHIHAGRKKVVGSPFKPLSEEDHAELQKEVDAIYDVFTEKVAISREISVKEVRDTEAGVFTGQAGVDADLVDGITTGAELLSDLNGDAEPMAPLLDPPGSSEPQVTTPPHTAGTEGGRMSKPAEGGGVVSLEKHQETLAKLKEVEAKNAINEASLEAAKEQEKVRVIDSHVSAGRVVPSMRELVDTAAKSMTAVELDAHLHKLPTLTHTAAQGVVDGEGANLEMAREVSRATGISLRTVQLYGEVKSVGFDGKMRMNDGTVVDAADLKGRG